jgi:biotin carboxyl carrier protein
MYPKVFLDYMGRHKAYGPVRTLPTPTFFYGMAAGDEIAVEIDPGKTLEIRLQAVGETTEDGEVKVFFELNGQPRVIRVPNRAIKAKTAAKPKAQEGNPAHIGAPMPGAVPCRGHRRAEGAGGRPAADIEAMKMETGLHMPTAKPWSRRSMSIPAARSTPRICWSSWSDADTSTVVISHIMPGSCRLSGTGYVSARSDYDAGCTEFPNCSYDILDGLSCRRPSGDLTARRRQTDQRRRPLPRIGNVPDAPHGSKL